MGGGGEKKSETNVINQSSTPTPSPQEVALNQLDLERRQASQGDILASDKAGFNLNNAFLQGQPLPGYFQGLPGGISPDVTTGIVNQSLGDLNTQLAKSGAGTFLESGAAQSIGARTAGEIRQNAEQFNLGQLLNLLNLSIGAPAQIQQPINQNAALFSSRLAGLRSTNSIGTSNSTSSTMGGNPFLRGLGAGLGTTLGSPKFMAGPFGFGG